MNHFPHLFSPVTVGSIELPNRLVMGSMHTGFEEHLEALPNMTAYFVERAKGGTALLVTGGYSPTTSGRLMPFGEGFTEEFAKAHRTMTDEVHAAGGRILLQLLHSGRYGYHQDVVSCSATQASIAPFPARELSDGEIRELIDAYAEAARLATEVGGYDGVEIMGSEGYLINQFLAARTNLRDDDWGGDAERRRAFPLAVVRAVREAIGPDKILDFRISLIDLVEEGQTWEDVATLATELEAAGVDVFMTGIGWHEAPIPTIVTSVPNAAWTSYSERLREVVSVPVITSNRINTPRLAESLLVDGHADLISMARPMLADPEFAMKAQSGRADAINHCIACNQACLDRTFDMQIVSCLVNPRAGRETELVLTPVSAAQDVNKQDGAAGTDTKVAVIGAGVAGLAFAEAAATRGLQVEVFEAAGEVGGQFRLAAQIPGKEDYHGSLRFFTARLAELGVPVRTGSRMSAEQLLSDGFDQVVVATGVVPRIPEIEGINHPMVMNYQQLLSGEQEAGEVVAVLGAGGIGVDVSEFLTRERNIDVAHWMADWGVVGNDAEAGGVAGGVGAPTIPRPLREVHLFQRKTSRIGKGLGKTTGWVHRAELKRANVQEHTGVTYQKVDDAGLHYADVDGEHLLACDTVVLCTGQESNREAAFDDPRVHIIGGADVAAELDAERAIHQAVELAAKL